MLNNFRFAQYRFTYTVREPLKMPHYKGSIFRSRFGYLLRDIACIGDTGQCEKKCQHPDRCVYSKCFETPVPADTPILRGQPSRFLLMIDDHSEMVLYQITPIRSARSPCLALLTLSEDVKSR